MTSSQSPLLPLDIRLRTLESQIYGVPNFLLDANNDQLIKRGESSKSIIRQVRESAEIFDRLSSESEGIKRLIEGYDQYFPLINSTNSIINDNQQQPASQSSSNKNDKNERMTIRESDLLPDKVKLTMILESFHDLRNSERDLREIDLLKKKQVQGSGNLEELLPLKPNLINSIKQTQIRSNELSKVKKDIENLLNRYNEYTSTTSDLFIDLHYQLQYLEDRVSKLERKKKKEIEGRF
ncbi:uncharacterized protein L201_006883 [Kwoniella dendrophila CBS 6074]|uniref:Uncharacterized protein n=1 Tax=Kwoniella dendrophila CBS 6074 TaxID=1295534 RepID=A0AAX4K2L0_9TREE